MRFLLYREDKYSFLVFAENKAGGAAKIARKLSPSPAKAISLKLFFGLILFCLSASGCAKIMETPKMLWGSSTRALEQARGDGFIETYPCNLELCFQDILDIAEKKKLDVFIADRRKFLIVLMGFEDSVNTTEVGFFLTPMGSTQTKIEILSLSEGAQYTAVKMFSMALDKIYNPDKITEILEDEETDAESENSDSSHGNSQN